MKLKKTEIEDVFFKKAFKKIFKAEKTNVNP